MSTTVEQVTEQKVEETRPPEKPGEKEPVTHEPADESKRDETAAQLAALQDDLGRMKQLLDEARHERDLQRVLMEAGVVDLEAGVLLLNAAVGKDDGGVDDTARRKRVETAVRELVRTRPALFRPLPGSAYATSRGRGAGVSATALARFDDEQGEVALTRAARAAAAAGDRRSLMDYLRLRRVG